MLYVFPVANMAWFFQNGQNDFLADKGFDLHIAASPGVLLDKLAKRDRITVHPIEITRYPSPLCDLLSLWKLMRLIRRLNPEIVHAGTPKGALIGMLAAWLCGTPVRFFAAHGTISARYTGLKRFFYKMCERLTASLSHRAWCVSQSLREYFRAEGIAGGNIAITIGNGSANGIREEWLDDPAYVLPESLQMLKREKDAAAFPVLGFLGRIEMHKGVDTIARAWMTLRERHPTLRLMIAGEWDPVRPLERALRDTLEADPRVLFPGAIERGSVASCLRLMDIFLLPSRAEGFGLAIIEAGVCELPVIATDTIGCRDSVENGVTGTFIRPDDAEQLVEAVERYLADPELARRHGRAGRERALRDFKPETIWNGLYAEYMTLLAACGRLSDKDVPPGRGE
ncbi:MAG: glycosyltransferase family 4 protein [Clostridia bacterium]|nr:glycosyltransferase family 4 protein [Clostridia bacterium]